MINSCNLYDKITAVIEKKRKKRTAELKKSYIYIYIYIS